MTTKSGKMLTTLIAPNGVSVPTVFEWTEDDPYAIRVQMHEPGIGDTVLWVFARELLKTPLTKLPSEYAGDVCVMKLSEGVFLGLRSPYGDIVMKILNYSGVHEFLNQTYQVVPAEMESDLIQECLESTLWAILETEADE